MDTKELNAAVEKNTEIPSQPKYPARPSEQIKQEKYLAMKELFNGYSFEDTIYLVEYFTRQIRVDTKIG